MERKGVKPFYMRRWRRYKIDNDEDGLKDWTSTYVKISMDVIELKNFLKNDKMFQLELKEIEEGNENK